MAERAHVGAGIAVRYDRARCRHVAECVRGLPLVFDPGRRPWIVVDDESDALLVAGWCVGARPTRCSSGVTCASTSARRAGGRDPGGPVQVRALGQQAVL